MEPLSPDLNVPAPRHDVDVAVLVQATHDLLAARVPLTLLLDLAEDSGPRSSERYRAEGGDLAWLTGVGAD